MKRLIPLVSLSILASALYAEELTIVADDWCPFNCAEGAIDPGFMIEIAAQSLEGAGTQVAYSNIGWDEAIEKTRGGAFSAIVGAAKGDAPDFVFPTEPQGWLKNSFYTLADSDWSYTGPESLGSIRLGVIEGYSYDAEVDKYVAANPGKLFVAKGNKALEMLIEALMNGEIDALVEGSSVFSQYFVSNGLLELMDQCREAGTAGDGEPIYVAFSPSNPKSADWAKLVSEGTARLRESGELAKILAKYYVEDWK
ncbi:substrate-binding periplasmic protein [Pelagicoccus mobilis]|uniref:Transporter substrate-binding domain-containing protein n=1 Tax=Pelagicoccus mobilis TaxID=415221 RepID=A0A934S568_9BACT|nr:transporter substrate-binding domain-containing protein [Pelagicoccus mobilis]MBK1879168.1 transporter substrate-binding domain-containing protein [Pelagicoccus mobilis]